MLEVLNKLDRQLFEKINTDWTSPFFDSIAPWWRYQNTWLPLYLFLLLFILMNFGWRVWPYIVLVALTVTLTDQVSSHLIKLLINKPRPCHDPLVQHFRLLVPSCSDSPGFTSSHAANHFGIAFLLYYTLKPVVKKWGYLLFFWAATISYAQIYVGIHFPLDVLGGTLIGVLAGCGMAWVFNKYIRLPPLLERPWAT